MLQFLITFYFFLVKVRVWRKAFFILFGIIFVQALNGAFTVVTYASTILATSGVTVSVELQALSFPIFMLISSFVSMTLVDKLGRRVSSSKQHLPYSKVHEM